MEDLILKELATIKNLSLLAAKKVLTIQDCAALTGLSVSYLYKLTFRKEIPFYKPNGKLLYFDRNEIETWMLRGKVLTNDEAESIATDYNLKSHNK